MQTAHQMKKVFFSIMVIALFSCNQKTDEDKYRELYQREVNISSSYHDLSKMIYKLDSTTKPKEYKAAKDELDHLKFVLDSIHTAMKEFPGYDSIELNKYNNRMNTTD